jgi:hypothetical protein
MEKILDFDIIVYHSNCSDGVGALWCANHYKNIEAKIPCKAGVNPELDAENKIILFVDICPKFDYLLEITKIAKNIVILDHHQSTLDLYEKNKKVLDENKNLKIILDMERSGCMLSWDYFFEGVQRPIFIDYIGDRDLWTWRLPKSKEINAGLFESNTIDQYDLTKLTGLLVDTENKMKQFEIEGTMILKLQQKELKHGVKNALKCDFTFKDKVYKVWLSGGINPTLRSDLGNMLANKRFQDGSKPDFAAIYLYVFENDEWWISMRGVHGSPDLSKICSELGGGGHYRSAGFTITDPLGLKKHFTVL